MIVSNGFTLTCDNTMAGGESHKNYGTFHLEKVSERTIIERARREGWFIGTIRVTSGQLKSKVRSRKLVLCHVCKWLVMR